MNELKPLLNLSCSQAWIGYGGTLHVGLGELVEHTHPKLKGRFHGIWQVYSDFGIWRIYKKHELIAGGGDDDTIKETALIKLIGRKLKKIDITENSSDTILYFSDSMRIEILETSSSENNWDVLGPEIYLGIGPGTKRVIAKPDHKGPGLSKLEKQRMSHADICGERWNAIMPEGREEVYCSDCAYYLPLSGEWYSWDFGVCSCANSELDGNVVNVKIGCDHHKYALGDDTT